MEREAPGVASIARYVDTNRRHWNEVTPIHAISDFYDVEGFKAGKSTLRSIELSEMGDVSGKTMLHLQCHFGLDTMSWARRGARVTGVDFSDVAIDLARSLNSELGLVANFVLSDVYDLPNGLDERFDIVFTSYGLLSWLPDLAQWAKVAAHFLRPGGIFYMVEMHPFLDVFDERETSALKVHFSYFGGQPTRYEADGTYADTGARVVTPTYQSEHSLGEVVNSLIGAGLRIEFMHEFPYTCYQALPSMERGEDGWWRLKELNDSVPQTFSLKAIKD